MTARGFKVSDTVLAAAYLSQAAHGILVVPNRSYNYVT
jgi:hypothetical protein